MNLLNEKEQYFSVLDHKPGFFLGWVLYTLFKHVQLAQDMSDTLKQMHRQGTVVYAIKYRGHLDYLLYHYRFRRSRLPYPRIAFDMNISPFLPFTQFVRVLRFQILYLLKNRRLPNPFKTGFFREAIQQGTSCLLCLVDPKGFFRHFIHSEKDNIHFLLETQKDMEKPIYIVPQLILYSKTPEKDQPNIRDILFGYKDKPGTIRKIVLFFRHNRRAFIDFGRPLDLKAYLEQQPDTRSLEDMSAEIKQMLVESIDMQKRVILGPVMKSRQQLKEIVLKDREIIEAIEKKASGEKTSLGQVRRQANNIFDEIAADYNFAYIQFFHMALTWLWKKIYQGIDVDREGLAVVREWARRGSLVYVPSHKSHVDYLVLNYILFARHMHIPRIAAGQNLSFWPMGHIFRKSGAFFIRRSFKGTSLYPKIFARYITQLLKEGHPLEFFIEGGRSRSGKLVLPKTGFLSILLQAHEKGWSDDMVFIPASIGYDRILEEKSYIKELGGDKKEKENFKQVLGARSLLKRKYGKIYIRFGQPISLKEYLAHRGINSHATLQMLAFDLIKSINRVTVITPLALVASAILTKHRRGFQVVELMSTARALLGSLETQKISIASSLDSLEDAVNETISILIGRKVINRLEENDQKETFYFVQEERKKELEYYKNSIIHFFIPHSFIAVSLLAAKEEMMTIGAIFADYLFLKNLFKNEFVYDDENGIEEVVCKVMEYFLEASYISSSDIHDEYKITRLGYDELPIWAGFAKTFLESYWISVRSHMHIEKAGKKKSDLLGRMNDLGMKYYRHGVIEHIEGISNASFENAIRFIREDVLDHKEETGEKSSEDHERLMELSKRLYTLSHFNSTIR